jgi:hypothetical protein
MKMYYGILLLLKDCISVSKPSQVTWLGEVPGWIKRASRIYSLVAYLARGCRLYKAL